MKLGYTVFLIDATTMGKPCFCPSSQLSHDSVPGSVPLQDSWTTTEPAGRTLSDYTEHLEIDVDDQDEARPPWEEDDGVVAMSPMTSAREDTDWVPDAVLDVAYYLRQFKFNEFDRRCDETPTALTPR